MQSPVEPLCGICSLSAKKVLGNGRPGGLVVVGEAPGIDESLQGEPFVGASGELLKAVLENEVVNFETVYFTNSVLCRPPDRRAPSTNEIRCCNGRLLAEIRAAKPTHILLLGNAATEAVLGQRAFDVRGRLLEWEGIPILSTYHPAYVLRNIHEYRDFAYDIWKLKNGPVDELKEGRHYLLTTVEQARKVLEGFQGRPVVLDIETSVVSEFTGTFLCAGFTPDGEHYYIIPADVFREVAHLCETFPVICHNFQFEYAWLKHHFGVTLTLHWDTMLANYALDERSEEAKSLDVHSLKNLGTKYFNVEDWSLQLKPYLDDFSKIPKDMLYRYLTRDLQITWLLYQKQEAWLEEDNVLSPFKNLLVPASSVLADMHCYGIRADVSYLDKLREDLEFEIMIAQEELRTDLQDETFNVRSNLQLGKLFFDKLGLKRVNKNKLGKKEIGLLEKLYPEVDLLQRVLRLRKLLAMYSTNVCGLYAHIREDGHVHPRFLLHGTETGRLASANPNMQNIPGRVGARIRDIFCAREGYELADLDYKQLEFRIAAHLSQDPKLLDYILSGKDIHTEMACVFFNVDTPTHVQRRDAKTLVFGAAYGLHWKTVVKVYGLKPEFVQHCLGIMNQRFPVLKKYTLDIRRDSVNNFEVQSALGRKRRFYCLTNSDEAEFERQAGNHPIQSLASDICLSALIRIAKVKEVRPVLTIHDSIIVEVPVDNYDEYARKLVDIMLETPIPINVPLGVELKRGTHWGSAQEYKL